MRRVRLSKEAVYIIGIALLSFAVAMISCTGFGVSMIVAPAYIVSQKLSFLTFGQAECVVQGAWLIVFCAVMRRFSFKYLFSFVTGLFYGAVLDLWRLVIPHFNPAVTAVGSLPLLLRILYFTLGMVLTSFSVALLFQTYFYPQVYDFFVKYVSRKLKLPRHRFKLIFDNFNLVLAVALTLILFHSIVGVGPGTVIMAVLNGFIIGAFTKLFDKHFIFYSHFPRLESFFDIS